MGINRVLLQVYIYISLSGVEILKNRFCFVSGIFES